MLPALLLCLLFSQAPSARQPGTAQGTGQAQGGETEAQLKRTLEAHPDQVEAYRRLSRFYRDRSRIGDAKAVLRQGLKRLPQNPELLLQSGILSAQTKDFKAALESFGSIPAETAPRGYWEAVGRTSVSMGDFDKAEQAFQKHLERHPGSIRTLRTLTGIALKQGKTDQAWQYISEARKEAPASPQVLFDFAQVSLADQRVADATLVLRILLMMAPDTPEYLYQLGTALVRGEDFPLAIEQFTRYTELKPEDPRGHLMLGYAFYVTNQYAQASPQLEQALRLDSGLQEAEYYLALIAYKSGRDEEAIRSFQTLLAKSPQYGLAHLNLGKVHLQRGNFTQARIELEKATRMMPDNWDAHFQLSRLFAQTGEPQRAKQELELYSRLKEEQEARREKGRRVTFSN
ncbi:MAG: tetratricopeptide repeat protein [Acidobacteriota bacterium]